VRRSSTKTGVVSVKFHVSLYTVVYVAKVCHFQGWRLRYDVGRRTLMTPVIRLFRRE